MTFTQYGNRHEARGVYGTCYTIVEDHDDEPVLYYVEGTNTEHTTLAEAIAYCEALEATEEAVHKCHTLGIRAFGHWTKSNVEIDFLHTAIDELSFVYCPNQESIQAFIELTECCVDSYALSHVTELSVCHYSDTVIFQYDAHSDSFTPISSSLCNIISQLVK